MKRAKVQIKEVDEDYLVKACLSRFQGQTEIPYTLFTRWVYVLARDVEESEDVDLRMFDAEEIILTVLDMAVRSNDELALNLVEKVKQRVVTVSVRNKELRLTGACCQTISP